MYGGGRGDAKTKSRVFTDERNDGRPTSLPLRLPVSRIGSQETEFTCLSYIEYKEARMAKRGPRPVCLTTSPNRPRQGIAPAEQLLIRSINNADNARLTTMEPRQPSRFEKNTNI